MVKTTRGKSQQNNTDSSIPDTTCWCTLVHTWDLSGTCSVTPEGTPSTLGHSPHPLLGSLSRQWCVSPPRKVLTVLYLTESPVLWFKMPFLPAWHSTQKPFYYPRITEPSITEHQVLTKGMYILEEFSWARHWWSRYTKGILNSFCQWYQVRFFISLFPPLIVSFLHSFPFVCLFIVTRA